MGKRENTRWAAWRGLGLVLGLLLGACEKPLITTPLKLGDKTDDEGNTTPGATIPAELLERGRLVYVEYCRACHGEHGDGRGPSAAGLRPPPRDFRTGSFKFGSVPAGELPSDDDLKRIIRGGLRGTAMLPWRLQDDELDAVVQYIKTFRRLDSKGQPTSSRFQEEAAGKAITISDDPYAPKNEAEVATLRHWRLNPAHKVTDAESPLVGREEAALLRGKKIYHSLAQCASCHPAYATRTEIGAFSHEITTRCLTEASFRGYSEEPGKSDVQAMFFPDPKGGDYRFPVDPLTEAAVARYGVERVRRALFEKSPSDEKARAELLGGILEELSGDLESTLRAALPKAGGDKAPASDAVSQEATSEAASQNATSQGARATREEMRRWPRLSAGEERQVREVLRDALEEENVYFLLPPDFLLHTLRTVRTEDPREAYVDLYRVIASGIGGTAMPPWKEALPEEDLWALAHYVFSLVEMQEHPESSALRRLRDTLSQEKSYQAPEACREPASAPVAPE
jgi:mono/diheme cytochrome c family protein